MIFTADQAADVRQGVIRAALAKQSERLEPGALRALIREVTVKKSATPELRREVVRDDKQPGQHEGPIVWLAIIAVDAIDVSAVRGPEALTLPRARACGYRTPNALREAWRIRYPRISRAQLAWFMLGALRDQPVYLQWSGRGGGDYTHSGGILDAGEVLDHVHVSNFALNNSQKDHLRRIELEQELDDRSLAERVARIERAHPALRREIRHELMIVQQRVTRAERKLRKQRYSVVALTRTLPER